MRRHIHRHRRKLLSLQAWRIRLVFWGGALLLGGIAASFALAATRMDHGFRALAERWPWLPFLMMPLGLMLINWLTRRFFPGAGGSGIPQVIAALQMKQRATVLSFRIAVGKLLLTSLGLFCGASIGREGPTVHIGASIMYSLRRFASFPDFYYRHGLIAAGGAAGVAAAFNTPLAGIVFALEEISRSFEARTNGVIMTAVIFAGLTAMSLLGNYSYFGVSQVQFALNPMLVLSVLVCGIAGGLIGGLFSQALISGNRWIKPWIGRYPLRVTALLGLLLATLGWLSGHSSFGTGYEMAYGIITGEGTYDPWFPLYKFLATLGSYLTGIPGGIFAPSLATGAGIGQNLAHWLPIAPVSFMVMIGMVAYFAGVIQAPITAMVIVLEMTSNENMIFPLMISALLGSGASSLVCPRSLYRVLAEDFLQVGRQIGKAVTGKPDRGDQIQR
jgi:H+/Cl- antiporter ClcA